MQFYICHGNITKANEKSYLQDMLKQLNVRCPTLQTRVEATKIIYTCDLPGTVKENIDIQVDDKEFTLKITAKRIDCEIIYETSIEFEQNSIDYDSCIATYENGVLTISFDKVIRQPRKINVTVK